MKKVLILFVLVFPLALAQNVTITYWQYEFRSKVEAINELIRRFEAQNPGIKVVHQTFPYDAFQQKVVAAIPAGQGPDVVNLYYGWAPTWVKAGYLVPLPEDWTRRLTKISWPWPRPPRWGKALRGSHRGAKPGSFL